MAFLVKVLSGNNEKAKQTLSDTKHIENEFQSSMAIISTLIKENHEVKAAVERIFSSSSPEAQEFLKSPTIEYMLPNEKVIGRLFFALSTQGMPVAASIYDLSRQHGLGSIYDVVLKYLKLLSPFIVQEQVVDGGYSIFDAIDDGWHGEYLFRNKNLSKASMSLPASPLRSENSEGPRSENHAKLMKFVSQLLHRRSSPQRESVSVKEPQTEGFSDAIHHKDLLHDSLDKNIYVLRYQPDSIEATSLTNISQKDTEIKKDLCMRRSLKPQALFSNANVSQDHPFAPMRYNQSGDEKSKANLAPSTPRNCASSSMPSSEDMDPSNRSSICGLSGRTECDCKKVTGGLMQEEMPKGYLEIASHVRQMAQDHDLSEDGHRQMAQYHEPTSGPGNSGVNGGTSITKENIPSDTKHSAGHDRGETISDYTSTPKDSYKPPPSRKEGNPSLQRVHSRQVSYPESENMVHSAHFKRISCSGSERYSLGFSERENLANSTHLKRLSYAGSEGHSFSMYTTDSEDECLSISTEVSLLVAASEIGQPDFDLEEEVNGVWILSNDCPAMSVEESHVSENIQISREELHAIDSQETNLGLYNAGVGADLNISLNQALPSDRNEQLDARHSDSKNELEAEIEVLPATMSTPVSYPSEISGDMDSWKLQLGNDQENANDTALSSDAFSDKFSPSKGIFLGLDMYEDGKLTSLSTTYNKAEESAQSELNPYDTGSHVSENFAKGLDDMAACPDLGTTILNDNGVKEQDSYLETTSGETTDTAAQGDSPANVDIVFSSGLIPNKVLGLDFSGPEFLEAENPFYSTQALDECVVLDTIQQDVLNKSTLNGSRAVINGQDSPKTHVALLLSRSEDKEVSKDCCGNAALPLVHLNALKVSDNEQNKILGDSEFVESASSKDECISHEKVQTIELFKQEPLRVFSQLDKIDCDNDSLNACIEHLSTLRNAFLQDSPKLDTKHDTIHSSNSKLRGNDEKISDEFLGTLDADFHCGTCEMDSRVPEQSCSDKIRCAEHQTSNETIAKHDGIVEREADQTATSQEQQMPINSHLCLKSSRNTNLHLLSSGNSGSQEADYLFKHSPDIPGGASSCHKGNEIAEPSYAPPSVCSCLAPIYAVLSHMKKKSGRSG